MSATDTMGTRRFGRVNWLGLATLTRREIRRFMSVWTQTVAGPLVSSALLLAVFALAVGPRRGEVMGVPFIQFLAPGILMMTVIQNAFANTSSSLMVAKVQGNIVDTLMPPLSAGEMLFGYLAGAIARGALVAVAVLIFMLVLLGGSVAHPLWLIVFVVLGGAMLGALGLVAAIYAQKFDQMAAITNFIVTPLSFLSGTFYSLDVLPRFLQIASHANPFFYLIDGARFAVIGQSDSSPVLGLVVCLVANGVILGLVWQWLRSGYRLKA
ncbi:multidrug ABC transporter permease [Actibacterium mucosum KCTC 23349]|uniref:Transport permease protein n=1 Tax=Actibacterium mucosum KCTC 23349 TaxID=1454373 RepID=A0A037ZJ75_9RHOB|nr:ABC transporter permease [Actibacterium mucosum]KAJ56163.1 multidrug ABC transporter permease [Actibacterium mucosum KCTC 23349]